MQFEVIEYRKKTPQYSRQLNPNIARKFLFFFYELISQYYYKVIEICIVLL